MPAVRIVRMTLLQPLSGGEREMAIIENHPDSFLPRFECFWLINEPEILKQFEGSNRAYFEAHGVGREMRIGRRVDDQGW